MVHSLDRRKSEIKTILRPQLHNNATMTELDKVTELLESLKTATPDRARLIFGSVIEISPFLPNNEKETVAVTFYQWTQQHTAPGSLHYAYGKYMRGYNALWQERHQEALAYLGEAKILFEDMNDADGVALVSAALGSIYRTLGNFDLALMELWESYDQLKRSGAYIYNMFVGGYQVGSIYLELKNYDKALPVFLEVLKRAEDMRQLTWIAGASQGLCKLNMALNRLPEARRYIDEALASAEEMKSPMMVANMLTDMADYYLRTGDDVECEKLHLRALEIREERKLFGGAITNYARLAELYMQRGDHGTAADMLNRGMALAQQLKLKPRQYAIHKLLAELYEAQQDMGKSLMHYKQYYDLRDEVERDDNEKKVRNLQTIFEAEQTRKENVIIKQQKAEIEQKNIALQETIDELTRTKVGKKAKAFTLVIAIVLFMVEELILHSVLHLLPEDNFYLSFLVKMVIILSLKPIDSAIEHYLLKKIIRNKKQAVAMAH